MLYTTILFINLVIILAIYVPYSRKSKRSKFLNIAQSDSVLIMPKIMPKFTSVEILFCQFPLQFYHQPCLFPYHVIL